MRQLGHSSSQMTMEVYTHLLKETNQAAAQKTDELIFGEKKELLTAVDAI